MEDMTPEPVSPRIRVEVETSYIEEQSDPRDKRFVFSYTITIRNEGQVPARLLTRHWRSPGLKQRPDNICVTVQGGAHQRSRSCCICGVHICSSPNEYPHRVE